MEYKGINEERNFRQDYAYPINQSNMKIAEAPKETIENIHNVLDRASSQLGNNYNPEEYKSAIEESKNAIALEREAALKKIKKLETEESGYAIISLLMIVGLIGLSVTIFLTINNLIH